MGSSFIDGVLDAVNKKIITEEEGFDTIKLHYKANKLDDILNRDLFCFRMALFFKKRKTFKLDINYLQFIHYYIFNGLIDTAGEIRTRNISRREDCLHFRSVIYSEYDMILDNITYDFAEESKKNYRGKSTDEKTVMISKFVSNIWQAHPFNDGNTRTDMIFLQKYLDHLQIYYDNRIFENNFNYFRNALVRSNYNTIGWIEPTYEYLYTFIYNLLTGNIETLNINDTFVPEEKMLIKHR